MASPKKYHAMTKAEREEFTKALIEAVQLHPAIWQMESGVYRDNGKKARAWLEIGQGLGQSEQTCQTTWKNARAYYSKIKREKTKRSEELDEPVEDCFWVHFKAMEFVAPYVDDRAGKYRKRDNASEDGDFLSTFSGPSFDGAAGLHGLSMVVPSTSGVEMKAEEDLRSATSTPSSGVPHSEGGPAKRRREEPLSPDAPAALPIDLHGFIDAIVTKKVLALMPPPKELSTPGSAFGNFLGIILDALPEQTRNEKIVAILNLLNKTS